MPVDAPPALMMPADAPDEAPGVARDPAADAAQGVRESVPLLERMLLRRLQRGDPRAFRELVRKHQDKVFSMSLRMLGDAHEAEDLAQEVFASVHRHLPRFRGDCRLSTWIFRMTRNYCLNRLKYLAHRTHEGDEALGRVDASTVDLGSVPDAPDRQLLGAEERAQVHRALQRISPEHRLIVVLKDIEGLENPQIAQILDIPAGTVKSRLHRARAALAEALEAAGMKPDGSAT